MCHNIRSRRHGKALAPRDHSRIHNHTVGRFFLLHTSPKIKKFPALLWYATICFTRLVCVCNISHYLCYGNLSVSSRGTVNAFVISPRNGRFQVLVRAQNSFLYGRSFSKDGDREQPSESFTKKVQPEPSEYLMSVAHSQFELLANSLLIPSVTAPSSAPSNSCQRKIKSMALYLPHENKQNGQLEFQAVAVYPGSALVVAGTTPTPPTSKFKPVQIPRLLRGYTNATTLLPNYPFLSSIGGVEEVQVSSDDCAVPALSMPLSHGAEILGVLLVWPMRTTTASTNAEEECPPPGSTWSKNDRKLIALAAQTLSAALTMEAERHALDRELKNRQEQIGNLGVSLSDNLHQVKNPLQALRTFSRLLQLKLALEELDDLEATFGDQKGSKTVKGSSNRDKVQYRLPRGRKRWSDDDESYDDSQIDWKTIKELSDNMSAQSDRVVDLLAPMDSIVSLLQEPPPQLPPSSSSKGKQQGYNINSEDVTELPNTLYSFITAVAAYSERQIEKQPLSPPSITQNDTKASVYESANRSILPQTQVQQEDSNGSVWFGQRPPSSMKDQSQNDESANHRKQSNDVIHFGDIPTPNDERVIHFGEFPKSTTVTSSPIKPLNKEKLSTKNNIQKLFQETQTEERICHPLHKYKKQHLSVGDVQQEMAFIPDVVAPILSACQAMALEQDVTFVVLGLEPEPESKLTNNQFGTLPGARVCPKSFQEALANVIMNAVKYSTISPRNTANQKSGGSLERGLKHEPWVQVSLQPNPSYLAPGVTILVKDNGPGIPMCERERVFERGYRSPTTSQYVSGSGIGLEISRELMSRMGGSLDIMNADKYTSTNGVETQNVGAIMRLRVYR